MQFTTERIQKYTRIALQYLAMYLMTHGLVKSDATWIEPAIGFGVAGVTFAWTIWGDRINAKLAEIAKVPGVTVVAPKQMADAIPADNVISSTEVKVVPK